MNYSSQKNIKEFTIIRHQEIRSVPPAIGTGTSHARDEERNGGHNSNADICKKAVDHEFIISGGYSAEFYGWTAMTASVGTAIRQVPCTFLISMLEDKIQKPNDYFVLIFPRKPCCRSKKWTWSIH